MFQETHGLSDHPLYGVWSDMNTRCYNPNSQSYSYYGGRGIVVCDEWKNDFMTFYNDMANDYVSGLELDREDVNGIYCKNNCRWATKKQQSRNRRSNQHIEIDGETKLMIEWAEATGVSYKLIHQRYFKYGFRSKEDLFRKPVVGYYSKRSANKNVVSN